ncbi:hypothetical protein ACHMW5_04215 [Azospirillum melinis]|uniref:hypothetical protein n=1 Tax=Azospirillum melinis TaxID=328839 RepID=UPI0037566654
MSLAPADAWSRLLLIDLDRQLAVATAAGLPVDPLAMSVAHMLHGVELARHATGIPAPLLAEWLSMLAACVERDQKILPILVWQDDVETDDAAGHA